MPRQGTPTAERSWQIVLPAALHTAVEKEQARLRLSRSEIVRRLVAKGLGKPGLAEIQRGRPAKTKGK